MRNGSHLIHICHVHSLLQTSGIETGLGDETLENGVGSIRVVTGESGKRREVIRATRSRSSECMFRRMLRGRFRHSFILQGRHLPDALHVQFAKKFRHRKRLMQATGKAIRLKLLRFHVATGGDRYYRNGLRLGEIRCTQQFQQVETAYCRHLYIGEQYVKSPGA